MRTLLGDTALEGFGMWALWHYLAWYEATIFLLICWILNVMS